MIISAWWLRTSSKFSGKKSKTQPENLEMGNSLAGADSSKIYRHRCFLVPGGWRWNKQTTMSYL